MTNLQLKVKEFINRRLGEDLMQRYYPKNGEQGFSFKFVDGYGGEDCGSDYWTVTQITHEDFPNEHVLVKASGWYQSYNGADYSDWEFVKPVQKTITVYE